MNRELEELVRSRAQSRCEYCQMPEEYDGFTHEIDHVIAIKHGGPTVAGNLVLACFPCNNHKGPNIAGLDPATRKLTPYSTPGGTSGRDTSAGREQNSSARLPSGA